MKQDLPQLLDRGYSLLWAAVHETLGQLETLFVHRKVQMAVGHVDVHSYEFLACGDEWKTVVVVVLCGELQDMALRILMLGVKVRETNRWVVSKSIVLLDSIVRSVMGSRENDRASEPVLGFVLTASIWND